MIDPYERQAKLEQEGIQEGINKYYEAMEKNPLDLMPPGVELLRRSLPAMIEAIKKYKSKRTNPYRMAVAEFMDRFKEDEMAYIIIRRMLLSIYEHNTVQTVATEVSNDLIEHLNYKVFKKQAPGLLHTVEENLHTSNIRHRKAVIGHARNKFKIPSFDWPVDTKISLGCTLINLFIENVGFVRRQLLRRRSYIVGEESVKEWIEQANAKFDILDPILKPMIVPPVPWEVGKITGGGYLTNTATMTHRIVRTYNRDVLDALNGWQMPNVTKALNAVQETRWRINTKIYKVLKQIWDEGGRLGHLPPTDEEPIPPKPWNTDEEYEYFKKYEPKVVSLWKRQATEVYDRQVRVKAKRKGINTKLEQANLFQYEEAIYFPFNHDYRGRQYPIPPTSFLSPQGDDTSRALLEFADGFPLGEDGAYWLAVHIANCYGYDKESFDNRVRWVEHNEQHILKSAENPLDYTWWAEKDVDSPFLLLAACFEWAGYKKEGPSFKSYIPIQMDGSANGLQHLSAMLLDEIGGAAVNLLPGNKPTDIYAMVAKELIKLVENDIINGKSKSKTKTVDNSDGTTTTITTTTDEKALAKAWQGKIDRGICKRGTMTFAYSVTPRGVTDQLMAELSKRYADTGERWLDVKDELPYCLYLSERLLQAIRKVVLAAAKIMDWLKEVVALFNKAELPIKWVTPSGFLAIMDNRKYKVRRIRTTFGGIEILLNSRSETQKINKVKQLLGISANLIHSFDSAHLQLTVCAAYPEIKHFSLVHDSYGTHAANITKLNRIIREQFVAMYSVNQLESFRNQIIKQLPEELRDKVPPIPDQGKLDIQQVLDSKYCFS